MITRRTRAVSIRATLVAMTVALGLYLGLVGAWVLLNLAPAAARMQARTGVLSAEYGALRSRDDRLRDAFRDFRVVASKPTLTSADQTTLATLGSSLGSMADNSAAIESSLRLTGVSAAMRAMLADAAAAESRCAAVLREAVDYLDRSERDAADRRVGDAERERERMVGFIDGSERLAFVEMVDRERALGAQAAQVVRTIGAWALVGTMLLFGLAMLIRQRLYAPLASLDAGLERVARGHLQTSLPVHRNDEFGRLAAQFNTMTEWLRIRASEDRERESRLVERNEMLRVAAQRIAEIALTAPTIEAMFRQIHEVIGGLMPASNFYLALYDEETNLISFPYFVDEEDADAPEPKKPGRGCTEYVLRTGKPLLLTPEIFQDLAIRGEVVLIGPPSADWLGVPLVAGGKTIGVLVVQSYGSGPRHTEEDLGILQFVSTQVGMAVMRRRAEQILADSRRHLQSVLDAAPFGAHYYEVHADGRLVFTGANRSADQILGVSNAQFVGRTIEECFPALVGTEVPDSYRRAAASGVPFDVDQVDYDEQGVRGAFEVHAIQTAPGHMAAFFRDITERKRAETALLQYRTLVDRARDLIFALSPEGTVTTLNPAFETLTGFARDQWIGRPFVEMLHPDDAEKAIACIGSPGSGVQGSSQAVQLRLRARDKGYRIGELQANELRRGDDIVGVLGVVRDITDRVHLEEQVRHAQKMESIGRLAGGVAHDFNNLLTVMLGFAVQAKDSLAPADPARADLAEVEDAGAKAATLTRQLLAFARRQVTDPRPLDLNIVTLGMEKMLRRLIGEHIHLETRLADDLWTVFADLGQIEQVIVNLAVNARDAMTRGGTLNIETSNATVGESHVIATFDMLPGEYVKVAISDTGEGIPPAIQEHIFEPFFTTKEMGRGTGLGLATCYGIIKHAGGWIWASSEPGRGATFTFYLPRILQTAERMRPTESRQPDNGTERILLVEDEESVRKIASRTLKQRGYQVTEAPNGQAAFEIAIQPGADFDLLLTDVVMPVMGGHELAQRLLSIRPSLKVLFTSGYTDEGIVRQGVLNRDVAFLPKPYDLVGLARKVRAVLDGTT